LNLEGLNELVAIKAAMNLGLSGALKVSFPDIIPKVRPEIKSLGPMESS